MFHKLLLTAALVFGVAMPTDAAAQVLAGRVIDLESTTTPSLGVKGARIVVRDRTGKVIREGKDATNAEGNYNILLPPDVLTPLAVEFRKVGYVDNPAPLKVLSLARRQNDLGMAATGRDAAYYRRVADATIAQQHRADQVAYLSVVASLPEADQQQVAQRFKEKADKELLDSYESVKLARTWNSDYSKLLDDTKFRAVQGQTQCGQAGCKLWFYGAVRSRTEETELKRQIDSRWPNVVKDFDVLVSPEVVNVRLVARP